MKHLDERRWFIEQRYLRRALCGRRFFLHWRFSTFADWDALSEDVRCTNCDAALTLQALKGSAPPDPFTETVRRMNDAFDKVSEVFAKDHTRISKALAKAMKKLEP